MKWYRVFYKKRGDGADKKSHSIIEFQAKKFMAATVKAEKMGKKKNLRLVMVAEVGEPTGIADSL